MKPGTCGILRTSENTLGRCVVDRSKPWLISIAEPLPTKAPSPALAAPYCCYIRTIIFYHRPYVIRRWSRPYLVRGEWKAEAPGSSFIEWDRVESLLTWDDLVEFEGDAFSVGSGSVIWRKQRWWMVRTARRVSK
ncbi:MAG: hypothetical protein AAF707_00160 [Pseudomonadota bacterium]